MRKILFAFALLLMSVLVGCDPQSYAESGDKVVIEMEVMQVSAGFIEVTCTPDEPAYYLFGIQPVEEGKDPFEAEQNFMDLALDAAYVEYVQWRHSYLESGEKNIADFPSHSLNYGETTIVKNFLIPDTDYWIYCFVVDAESNKANGNLICEKIHTLSSSSYESKLRYSYRVRGRWDYIYPYDKETGELVTHVPWAGKTIDSLEIRSSGAAVPGRYFDSLFSDLDETSPLVHIGVYAFKNDGVGDGSSDTCFKEGHTYYTAIATVDGPRNSSFDIYKFTWTSDFEEVYDDMDSTGGAW